MGGTGRFTLITISYSLHIERPLGPQVQLAQVPKQRVPQNLGRAPENRVNCYFKLIFFSEKKITLTVSSLQNVYNATDKTDVFASFYTA